MHKKSLLLGVALAALTLTSCQKELEQITTATPSKPEGASTPANPGLMSSGSWRQTGLTVSLMPEGAATAETHDLFAQTKPSMLVQAATYRPDGTFSLQRGSRPDGQPAEPSIGQWHLNAAADSLILTQADKNVRRLAVTGLTATTLTLKYVDEAGSGQKGTSYTAVFSH